MSSIPNEELDQKKVGDFVSMMILYGFLKKVRDNNMMSDNNNLIVWSDLLIEEIEKLEKKYLLNE